jgi:hypothetical protein
MGNVGPSENYAKYIDKLNRQMNAITHFMTGVRHGFERPDVAIRYLDELINELKEVQVTLIYFQNTGQTPGEFDKKTNTFTNL